MKELWDSVPHPPGIESIGTSMAPKREGRRAREGEPVRDFYAYLPPSGDPADAEGMVRVTRVKLPGRRFEHDLSFEAITPEGTWESNRDLHADVYGTGGATGLHPVDRKRAAAILAAHGLDPEKVLDA